jgi:Xaa-Pro aminopeptidase
MNRIDRLREAIASLGADAAIVSHPANRHYLSGFPADDHAPDESSGVLLVTPEAAVLYTSPTNHPWAASAVLAPVTAEPWQRPWPEFLAGVLRDRNVRNVAFEDRAMTVADHAALRQGAGQIEFLPAGNAFHALRAVKDEDEVAAIARAAQVTDAAFVAATAGLEPGVTERELAWRIEKALREHGAHGLAFPVIVAAGPHGAHPHHEPSDRPIGLGEPIVIDMGARIDGYCADLTRTICLGDPPAAFRDRYNSVLTAQRTALAGIRAGMSGVAADSMARDSLAAAGLGDQFIHGLGHGVGILIHEAPSLGKTAEEPLLAGQVVTVEPGIYVEGWGGIRIEDLCVVRDAGLEILSAAPK